MRICWVLCLAIAVAFGGQDQLAEARAAANRGTSEWDVGHYRSAERWLARALEGYQRVLGPADSSLGDLYVALALAQSAQGKYAAAERAIRRALAVWGPDQTVDAAKSASVLASIESNRKRYRESAAQYECAVRMLEQSVGGRDPLLIGVLADYASVFLALKNDREAEALSRRAVALAETGREPHTDWARAEWTLARALAAQYRVGDAEPHFRKALELFQAAPLFDMARFTAAASDYAHVLRQSHRSPEAVRLESDASATLAARKGTVSVSEIRSGRL